MGIGSTFMLEIAVPSAQSKFYLKISCRQAPKLTQMPDWRERG